MWHWLLRWRASREAVFPALGWIVTLPVLASLLRWRRTTAAWIQNILGPISGLVWGRIGWIGVRRYGFSNEDAFLAGGLAGAVAPTVAKIVGLVRRPGSVAQVLQVLHASAASPGAARRPAVKTAGAVVPPSGPAAR